MKIKDTWFAWHPVNTRKGWRWLTVVKRERELCMTAARGIPYLRATYGD